MDPDAPRHVRDVAAERRSLTNVQRWVGSSLAVTTILHLTAGMIIAAMTLPGATRSGQIGLNVIGGAFAVVALGAGFAIHGRRIASWWLLPAFVVPTALGIWLTLR